MGCCSINISAIVLECSFLVKKIQATLSDEQHSFIKSYCAFYDITLSEFIEHLCKSNMDRIAHLCLLVRNLYDANGLEVDKRVTKICYGTGCFGCKHQVACRTGQYTGTLEYGKDTTHLLTEEGIKWCKAIKASVTTKEE